MQRTLRTLIYQAKRSSHPTVSPHAFIAHGVRGSQDRKVNTLSPIRWRTQHLWTTDHYHWRSMDLRTSPMRKTLCISLIASLGPPSTTSLHISPSAWVQRQYAAMVSLRTQLLNLRTRHTKQSSKNVKHERQTLDPSSLHFSPAVLAGTNDITVFVFAFIP